MRMVTRGSRHNLSFAALVPIQFSSCVSFPERTETLKVGDRPISLQQTKTHCFLRFLQETVNMPSEARPISLDMCSFASSSYSVSQQRRLRFYKRKHLTVALNVFVAFFCASYVSLFLVCLA